MRTRLAVALSMPLLLLLAPSRAPHAQQQPAPQQATVPQAAAQLQSLGWLAGEWRGKRGDTDVLQYHSDPAGGAIVMASKEHRGDKLSLFDFGVVRVVGDKVVMVPFPGGKRGPEFALVDSDAKAQRATFTNPEHDFPKTFVYQRTGDGLRITLTGDERGKPAQVDYELALATAPDKK